MSVSHIVLPVDDETRKQAFHRRFINWVDRHPIPDSVLIIFTAVIVGIGSGIGAVLFRWLIHVIEKLAFSNIDALSNPLQLLSLLLLPALGGLLVGLLTIKIARDAKGHGVPEVMEAVALNGGRIKPQVAVEKTVISAICIGSGGSAGSEGPIAQIGSAIGSAIGQWLKLSDDQIKNLVACGAGGGISAIFNTPIAGAMFGIEVVLGRLNTVNFGAVVISSVTADVIAQILEGHKTLFTVPQYTLVSSSELGLYAIMGLLLAFLSAGYTRFLQYSEDFFEHLHFLPEFVKPALGGILLGVLGILSVKSNGFPLIYGEGYESINEAISGNFPLHILLLLLLFKMVGTSFTLSSGNSGGIFAPTMYIGAMVGGVFGNIANMLFPAITAPSGAYAIVGMAAFMSGTIRAPITAILLIFELSGDYHIILPLMLCTVIATIISRFLIKDSIYTMRLSRRGIHLEAGQDIDVMQGVSVQEIMTTAFETVKPDTGLNDLAEMFANSHSHGYAVMDDENNLTGMVSISDLDKALLQGPITNMTVNNIATKQGLLVTYPDEPMWKALKRIGSRNISRLPVVEAPGSRKLVGIINEHDIIRAYNHAIAKRAHQQYKMEELQLGNLNDANFIEVVVPKKAEVIGKQIRQLHLPENCLIVSIRRGRKLYIADGYTVIQPGDRVSAISNHGCIDSLRSQLTSAKPDKNTLGQAEPRHTIVTIPAGSPAIGRMIKDIQFPHDIIIVNVRRKDIVIIPHGDTHLQADDVIELFGLASEIKTAREQLTGDVAA